MIPAVLAAVFGYLIGAFPSAIVVGRIWGVADLRGRGSGNPGTFNALRVLGIVPGAIVFALDFGKGLAATALPEIWFGRGAGWWGGLAAVAGHIYPVYAGFRGGKGLAAAAGAIAYVRPWFLGIFLPVWAIFFLAWRRSAPATLAAIIPLAVAGAVTLPAQQAAIVLLGSALIFWRHWPEAAGERAKGRVRSMKQSLPG